MAVYTTLSEDDLHELLAQYSIGALVTYKGISEGVENTNYKLTTDQGDYILTIYEKRVDTADLPFFLGLMQHVAQANIPSPEPVANNAGELTCEVQGKQAAITQFLNGSMLRAISNEHCESLGAMVARFHLATESFTGSRSNMMGVAQWSQQLSAVESQLNSIQGGIANEVAAHLEWTQASWPKDLPNGVVHADLFPDNVFFQGEAVSGLLDFYFACEDIYSYDLAIVLNAWCFEYGTEFNITKAKHLMHGYDSVRRLSVAEREALPVLACGAAIRFFLSRAHDWLHPQEGAIVTPKNPLEYLKKMQFHRKVKSPAEYGL